jgi:hypothetical protein
VQGWIQIKGKHLLYQLQVVLSNIDVRVAPTRPWKWLTQSVMTVTPILKKHRLFSCVDIQNFLNRFLSRVDCISLKIRRPKNNLLVFKFGKTTKILRTKKAPLQNQPSTKLITIVFLIQNPSILIRGPRLINHDQSLIEFDKKTLAKPYK